VATVCFLQFLYFFAAFCFAFCVCFFACHSFILILIFFLFAGCLLHIIYSCWASFQFLFLYIVEQPARWQVLYFSSIQPLSWPRTPTDHLRPPRCHTSTPVGLFVLTVGRSVGRPLPANCQPAGHCQPTARPAENCKPGQPTATHAANQPTASQLPTARQPGSPCEGQAATLTGTAALNTTTLAAHSLPH